TPAMSSGQVRATRNGVLKALMLSIIYGKSAVGIARDLPCTVHEATLHLQQFSRTYGRLFTWLRNFVCASLQQGFAEHVIGYRACYKVLDPRARNHMGRSCQNFPVQSSAAACFQLTGRYLANFGADIRLPLHDAYLLNVPNDPKDIARAREQVAAATVQA